LQTVQRYKLRHIAYLQNDDYNSEVDEIAEVLVDIENKLDGKQNIPRLTFKSLIESSSNLSSVGSLVISLGQILGIIPPVN